MRFIKVLKSRNGRNIDFEKISPSLKTACEKYGVLLLYIFGSYAKNNAGKLSDVDVAVLSEHKLDLKKYTELSSELQEKMEDEAIDLVDLRGSPAHFTHRVLKEGKCLYAKNVEARIDFETRSEMEYYDTHYLRQEYLSALERRIKDGTFGYR